MDRFHWTTKPDYLASCEDCGWELHGHNALGVAARHHDATGHTVHVEVVRSVVYEKRERYEARRAARRGEGGGE